MPDDEKDPVAQAMVQKRWDKTTAAQRSELARKMNAARWGKKPAGKVVKKKAAR
jgi:hypothetical protein